MADGIFDSLARRAAGLVGQHQRGRRLGEQERFERDRDAQIREDALQRQAFLDTIMANREAREAERFARPEPVRGIVVDTEEGQVIVDPTKIGQRFGQKPTPERVPRNIDPLSPEGIDAATTRARQLASIPRPGAGAGGVPAPKPGRALSPGEADKIGSLRALIRDAESASTTFQQAIDAGTNVTGPITGRLAPVVEALGMASPEQVSARGRLANVTSQVILARSGGAVSAQEFERLEPFLAGRKDREEVALQKLTDLMRHLRTILDEKVQAFADAGIDVSGFQTTSPGAASGAASKAQAWLAQRRGGRP